MKKEKIRQLLGIVTAVSLAVSAVCLGAGCFRIYRAGEFSPAAVAEAFRPIAVFVYISLGLCFAGGLYALFVPAGPEKSKAVPDTAQTLARLQSRTDLNGCDPFLQKSITVQRRLRRRLRLIRVFLLALYGFLFLSYALDGSYLPDADINAFMVRAMTVFVPTFLLCVAFCLVTDRRLRQSMEAEIALLKQAPKGSPAPAAEKRERKWVRWVILSFSLVLLVYGYATGGILDVLTKAVNICTECVGLG